MSRVIFDSPNRITQYFSVTHHGIDLGWRTNESMNEVYSNCEGQVIVVVSDVGVLPLSAKSWGNYVLISHPNGMQSRYCHLQNNIKVSAGEYVDANTCIGIIGNTGSTDGRHLHFEVYNKEGERINPFPYLTEPIYESTNSPEIKVGDKVLVLSGRLTADSFGGGNVTAEYDGSIHPEDITNYLIVDIIMNDGRVRPYHLKRTPERGSTSMGWASLDQIKKV